MISAPKITLDENDMIHVMHGAALLASGGGGSVYDGLDLLCAFKKHHPKTPVSVDVLSPDMMADCDYSVGVAVMGAPSGAAEQPDLTTCVTSAYEEAQNIARLHAKQVKYIMPLEMGGFNTFVPMLISMMSDVPLLDADCCGRAVPGLDTALSSINGCATAPIAMADNDGNKVTITTKDPYNAALVETMALPVVSLFQQNAGIAGWFLSREKILNNIPLGTVNLAMQIGEYMRKRFAKKPSESYVDDLFEGIDSLGLACARRLFDMPQTIREYHTVQQGGWDSGSFLVGEGNEANPEYKVLFSNENLVVNKIEPDGAENTVITAPDIISVYNAATCEPLTNEDLENLNRSGKLESTKVILGIIKVNDRWWNSPDTMSRAWSPYFEHIGYSGGIVRYPG